MHIKTIMLHLRWNFIFNSASCFYHLFSDNNDMPNFMHKFYISNVHVKNHFD